LVALARTKPGFEQLNFRALGAKYFGICNLNLPASSVTMMYEVFSALNSTVTPLRKRPAVSLVEPKYVLAAVSMSILGSGR
jgi:hypothetical protein